MSRITNTDKWRYPNMCILFDVTLVQKFRESSCISLLRGRAPKRCSNDKNVEDCRRRGVGCTCSLIREPGAVGARRRRRVGTLLSGKQRRVIVAAIPLARFCILAGPFSRESSSRRARLRRACDYRRPKRVYSFFSFFSDLSDYNRASRSFCVPRARRTLPRRPSSRARSVSLSLHPRRERRYEGDIPGDAWRYLAGPAAPALCSVRVRHCAVSRSPDYRDKQPEKPR